jgi:hypothetical protein
VGGLKYGGQDVFKRRVDVEDVHLGARYHKITDRKIGKLQHAFHHGYRIGIYNGVRLRLAELLYELLFFGGSSKEPAEEAFEGMTQA